MPNIANKQSNGLYNNTNTYNRPQGGLWIADNVVINKQDVADRRFGFKACANNLPTTIPEQMYSFNDSPIIHTNSEIWYEGDDCNWFKLVFEGGVYFDGRSLMMFPDMDYQTPIIYMTEGKQTFQLYHNVSKISKKFVPQYNDTLYYYENITGLKTKTQNPPAPASDGGPSIARLRAPNQICYGKDGNVAFFADAISCTIRQITLGNSVTSVLSGALDTPGTVDGAVGVSRVKCAGGVAYDSATRELYFLEGDLIILGVSLGPAGEKFNFRKVNVDTTNTTTIASDIVPPAVAIAGKICAIHSMFTTPTSSYCYANFTSRFINGGSTSMDPQGNAILRITKSTGATTVFSGDWQTPGSAVGTASATRFSNPGQLTGDKDNNYLYMPQGNYIIRISVADGSTIRWLGSGVNGKLDGIGVNCQLDTPEACGIIDSGYMFIVCNETVRLVEISTATCTTITSISSNSAKVDGPLTLPIRGPLV